MKTASQTISEAVSNEKELLYRCRWSSEDAARVVPELTHVLSDADIRLVDEALRCLFTIGTPAVSATPKVAELIDSRHPITRNLATLALGQIAHGDPELCLPALSKALDYVDCRHDALRILAFVGRAAKGLQPKVSSYYDAPDAKTRKLVVIAVLSIDPETDISQRLMTIAANDRSKVVRKALGAAMAKAQRDAPGT